VTNHLLRLNQWYRPFPYSNSDNGQDHANALHSTGRGGTGNFRQGPDETSTERERRLSTRPSDFESITFGRGGAGNIEAAKILQKKKEEEQAQREAKLAEQARAHARAAVEALQFPKPTRNH